MYSSRFQDSNDVFDRWLEEPRDIRMSQAFGLRRDGAVEQEETSEDIADSARANP